MKAPKPDKLASRKAIREFLMRVVIVVFMLSGAGVMAYPFVVNAINDSIGKVVTDRYQSEENEKFRTEKAEKLKKMSLAEKQKNKALKDPFSQVSLDQVRFDAFHPNYFAEHTIAVIYIPKISVSLPVFDSTNERFLSQGATWVSDTGFPGGGVGNHSVITGHRGLPTAELFTNLPKLEKGDIFIIDQNKKYLAYKVFEKQTVKPEDSGILGRKTEKDLVTLITCTPYMINSHRLLVTGERTPFTPNMLKELQGIQSAKDMKNLRVYATLATVILGAMWLLHSFWTAMQLKRRHYDLRFRILDEDGKLGLTQSEFQLFTANGKIPISKKGEFLFASPDTLGEVNFSKIPGGKYTVKQVKIPQGYKSLEKLKFKMKNIRSPFFTAIIKKRILSKAYWQQLKKKELIILNPKDN